MCIPSLHARHVYAHSSSRARSPDCKPASAGLVTRLLELARDEDLGIGGLPGDLTCKVTLGEIDNADNDRPCVRNRRKRARVLASANLISHPTMPAAFHGAHACSCGHSLMAYDSAVNKVPAAYARSCAVDITRLCVRQRRRRRSRLRLRAAPSLLYPAWPQFLKLSKSLRPTSQSRSRRQMAPSVTCAC